MKPMAIDLYCGLGGWAEGFIAEDWDVIGFDIERHDYGNGGYPSQLVLQNILTLHGSQFRNAACIVASPPCQEFSYMAMPWSRGKQIAGALRGEILDFPEEYTGSRTLAELTALFDACFRIQLEAIEAAGRYIPLVVENVKGAQPWVGRSKANFGSFHLWGDVGSVAGAIVGTKPRFGEILRVKKALKGFGGTWFHNAELGTTNPNRNRTTEGPAEGGRKVDGFNFHQHENGKPGGSFQTAAVKIGVGEDYQREKRPHLTNPAEQGVKVNGMSFSGHGGSGYKPQGFNVTAAQRYRVERDSFGWDKASPLRNNNSKSDSRKAASAQIAKIPLPLSAHIARIYRP